MTRSDHLLAETDALLAALEDDAPLTHGSHAEEVLARYDEVDRKLVAAGFPATSAWWREQFELWYRSGRRQFVPRVGRRGGKSSSLSRLAVVEALYGHHNIPPGDAGVVALVSTDRSEALNRLRTIEAILDALGVRWRPCKAPKLGIEIEVRGRPVEFRVFTASIAGVSGFTAVFVLCDEVSKWRDSETGVNPATQVLASVRPTMATQRNAKIVLSSSPLGKLDAHYDAFEEGDTAFQVVAHAPTWVANPTLTEADTHDLEPDVPTWEREYAAIPQAEAESSLLTEYLIERMTRPLAGDLPRKQGCFYFAAMDPATRGNAWTLNIATRDVDDVRRVVASREKRGSKDAPLSPKAVFEEWAPLLKSYGIYLLHTDQWAVDAMQDSARVYGITLKDIPWTTSSRAEAYEGLLKKAQDRLVEIPPEKLVKQDLLGIRKILTRNGVTYELATVKGRHSDHAPSVAMVVQLANTRPNIPREMTEAEMDAEDKREFLAQLEKDRKRRERLGGALPRTHRPFRG